MAEKFEFNDFTQQTFKLTKSHMFASLKSMEWLNYEVDPEWAQFCEFGPDDIGGPFEQIGIIRRRPNYDAMIVANDIAAQMNKKAESTFFESALGTKVISSPLIPPGVAYMFSQPKPLIDFNFHGIVKMNIQG